MKNRFTAANCKIALIAAALALCAGHDTARADERSELEQLRATTMSLIEALVETGAITREKADKLIQAAEQKAKERVAQSASAGTAAASPAEVGADGRKIVRVPYVPESVRREIREQVKQDVMAQAKEERWANPNVLPEWLDRFTFEGDLRLRYDGYKLDPTNTPSGPSAKTITRAPHCQTAASLHAILPVPGPLGESTTPRVRAGYRPETRFAWGNRRAGNSPDQPASRPD